MAKLIRVVCSTGPRNNHTPFQLPSAFTCSPVRVVVRSREQVKALGSVLCWVCWLLGNPAMSSADDAAVAALDPAAAAADGQEAPAPESEQQRKPPPTERRPSAIDVAGLKRRNSELEKKITEIEDVKLTPSEIVMHAINQKMDRCVCRSWVDSKRE